LVFWSRDRYIEVVAKNGCETNTYLQGGLLAEYYFAKHSSITAKLKYLKTRLSVLQSIRLEDEYYGNYYGAVIAIPTNVN
jgi:hypothetical protein